MTVSIAGLREEHAAITTLLVRVRQEGVVTRNGRRLLEQLREEVEHHLAREEAFLYPALRAAVRDDARLKATVELFAREGAELAARARAFFARVEQGEGGLELARDFGRLYAALVERMRREEAILFPAARSSA